MRNLIDGEKWCPTCGEYLSPSAFTRDRSRVDGLTVYCRECKRVRELAHPHTPEQVRDRSRRYYERHREQRKEYQRRYRRGYRAGHEQTISG